MNGRNKGLSARTAEAAGEVLDGKHRGGVRRLLPFIGPAFIASIAYVDPGNFATNIQAGSGYGYLLLWVILASNLMAMLIQSLAAKLGIAAKNNLAEQCRESLPRPVTLSMWVIMEAAAMATDLAEFLGAALGFQILFGMPLLAGGIAMHVKELGCDLVILCTHGSHVFTHPLFGSIAQRILALNTVPVLIVKPHSTTDPTAFAINRILVPITTDKAHPGGIEAAKSLAGIISVPLHVLLIVERFRDIAGNDVTVTRFLPSATRHLLDLKADTGETYLARIRSRLEKSGLTVTTSIRRNRPAEGIIDESRTSNADLIVMSTHRRKGIEAFWRGSVASKVCRRSMVPVLLVPEPDFPTESTQQSAGDHS